MFDDLLDTGGTALKGAKELKLNGVTEVVLVMTHAVASRGALEYLQQAQIELNGRSVRVIDRVFVTDSLPIATPKNGFVEVVELGDLYAHAILRLCQGNGSSLRELSEIFSGTGEIPSLSTQMVC
jgi:ribose-phosphate pyrophosphokinase